MVCEMRIEWLYSCCYGDVAFRICSKQLVEFLCSCHVAFSAMCFVSILIVHPYRSKDTATARRARTRLLAFCEAPGPVLDFGPERGPGKGTMADLGPLIRHLVSTRLPSGGRAAFLCPLSPLYGTRPSV